MGYRIIALVIIAALVAIGYGFQDMSRARRRKAAIANKEAILDQTFAGPTVTYRSTVVTLPFEVVLQGARARGYALTAQTQEPGNVKILIFERVA